MKHKRAAVYARLSVTTEESVSIARQVESCEKAAAARGWEVVGVYEDDGVSATKRKPADRPGFRRLLDSLDGVDVVIVWKVDRLARRVLDFLTVDELLRARGAALVAVEDPIDLTTQQGRAFATMLAVFGELEAATISSRSRGARDYLVRSGRAPGGEKPWPFTTAPNPDGPGLVVVPIPERAALLRDAAARIADGSASAASIAREWTAAGVPTQDGLSRWNPSSVVTLLRNPALTGATVHRGELLRNPDGTVSRDPARAILDPATFAAVDAAISARSHRSGDAPIRLPLLHGLALCDSCGSQLYAHRPKAEDRPARYVCKEPGCPAPVAVSMTLLDAHVSDAFLSGPADAPVEAWEHDPTPADPAAALDLLEALDDVARRLDADPDDAEALRLVSLRRELRARLASLRDAEAAARRPIPGVRLRDAWDADESDDSRRTVLATALRSVRVRKGRKGPHGLDPERVGMEWRT